MIVVLTGQKRSGKTTAADFFKTKNFLPLALADEFKKDLAFVISSRKYLDKKFSYQDANGETDFDREQKLFDKKQATEIIQLAYKRILGDDQKYIHLDDIIFEYIKEDIRDQYSFRELMQITGTDIGCNRIDQQIWVKKVFEKMIDSTHEDFIISDVRQNHEIDVFRKMGAKVIHIKRPGFEQNDNHITEFPLNISSSDIVIQNSRTLDYFYEKIEIAYEQVTGKE